LEVTLKEGREERGGEGIVYFASAKALLLCLCPLRLNVSGPCNKKAPNGFKHGPRSLSIYHHTHTLNTKTSNEQKLEHTSMRTLIANATGPNVSLNFIP
jgi:hypothetical protein